MCAHKTGLTLSHITKSGYLLFVFVCNVGLFFMKSRLFVVGVIVVVYLTFTNIVIHVIISYTMFFFVSRLDLNRLEKINDSISVRFLP